LIAGISLSGLMFSSINELPQPIERASAFYTYARTTASKRLKTSTQYASSRAKCASSAHAQGREAPFRRRFGPPHHGKFHLSASVRGWRDCLNPPLAAVRDAH